MKEEVIAFTDPKSPVSEMFKTLRTNIQFMNTNKPLKTLLVTSTLPGEGKSWTVANLAVTFAQAGKNVLIIDADMRKGRQFGIFEVPPTPGLSNYLSGVIDGESGNYELEQFIKKTELDNLFIMPAGNVPPNPTELLVSEKMINLIGMVNNKYDITIFDGTPGLLVADASIISRIVDSSIIVTAHNETKIDNVSEVKKAIENIGGKVAGVVINKIPISAKKYENTYYYGHTAPAIVKDKKKQKLNMRKQFFKEEKEKKEKENNNIFGEILNKFEKKEKDISKLEETFVEEKQPKEDIKIIKEKENKPEEVKVEKVNEEHIIKPINEMTTHEEVKNESKEIIIEPEKIDEVKLQMELEESTDVEEQAKTEDKVYEKKVFEEKQPKEEIKQEGNYVQETQQKDEFIYEEKHNQETQQLEKDFSNEKTHIIEPTQQEQIKSEEIKNEEELQHPEEVYDYEENNAQDETYEYIEPKLSWEEEAESAYEQIKREINTIGYEEPKEEKKIENIPNQNTEYTLDKTQEILDEINKYLDEQKNKLNNGGKND